MIATAGSTSAQFVSAQAADPALPGTSSTNDPSGSDVPTVTTGSGDGGIDVAIQTPGRSGGGGNNGGGGGNPPGPATFAPACQWTRINQENTAGVDDATTQITNDAGDLGWFRDCQGSPAETVWVTPAPDPVTLVQPASDRARAQLPLPTPNQSPAPDVGSFVNLGLWMSIEDPGATTARATVAGVWAEATGRFASFKVDPGDGSGEIPCDGFGVPYPEGSNNAEQGPCGHTYLQPTPQGAPHIVTYTITYDISWRTSDGRSGSSGSYDRQFQFPFDVNEIQTVGTGS